MAKRASTEVPDKAFAVRRQRHDSYLGAEERRYSFALFLYSAELTEERASDALTFCTEGGWIAFTVPGADHFTSSEYLHLFAMIFM